MGVTYVSLWKKYPCSYHYNAFVVTLELEHIMFTMYIEYPHFIYEPAGKVGKVFGTWLYNFISPPFVDSEERNLFMLLFYVDSK